MTHFTFCSFISSFITLWGGHNSIDIEKPFAFSFPLSKDIRPIFSWNWYLGIEIEITLLQFHFPYVCALSRTKFKWKLNNPISIFVFAFDNASFWTKLKWKLKVCFTFHFRCVIRYNLAIFQMEWEMRNRKANLHVCDVISSSCTLRGGQNSIDIANCQSFTVGGDCC